MKASDILQQYQNGQRNFQGLNLRGLNFAGKDLSGADFSGCQIQGTNFKKANLTGTNFTGAKAGLTFWQILINANLICLFGTFSQYFLFKIFQLPDISSSVLKYPEMNILFLLIVMIIHLWSFLKHSIQEKLPILLGSYLFCGILLSGIAISGFQSKNGEFFISLGLINLAVTIIFAICTSTILSIASLRNSLLITIFMLVTSAFGFWLGSLSSSATSSTILIIWLFISIISLISGAWNGWLAFKGNIKDPWIQNIAIVIASLGGTSFHKANLTDVNFTSATLKNTNFNQAIITRTCFKETINLNLARAGNTILIDPKVRDLLINPSSGYRIDLFKADLRGANLKDANLQEANLKQADISEATLQHANLTDANLTEVNAVNTNFDHVLLTGACIEAWNIDPNTNLENVECEYIFLLEKLNDKGNRERRPHDPDAIFEEGDFTRLYQKALHTLQLILRNGINPQAFREAFSKLMEDNPELTYDSIESGEKKGKDVVVNVKVPPNKDKGKLQKNFNKVYKAQLKEVATTPKLEEQDQALTPFPNIFQITFVNQNTGNDMTSTHQSQSGQGDSVAGDKTQNTSNYDFQNATVGGGVAGGDYLGDVIHNHADTNTNETLKEIQSLITELSHNSPTNSTSDQMKISTQVIETIENNPTLKQKVIAASQQGVLEVLKSTPIGAFVAGAIEGWKQSR